MTLTIAAPSICCSVGGKWSNAFGITNSNCHTQIALWNGVMETHNPTLAKWVFNVRIYMGILIHNFETKLSQTALGTDIVGFNLNDRGICCCFMLPSVGCLDRIVACINTTQAQNTIQRGNDCTFAQVPNEWFVFYFGYDPIEFACLQINKKTEQF